MEFWLDLANVYKFLLRTTALPRSATDHTSAIEHDELRRGNLTRCVENVRPALMRAIQVYVRVCGYRPWSVKDGTGVQHDVGVNTSTSLDLLQSVWSFR